MNVADLLREKCGNMQRWLRSEGCAVLVDVETMANVQLTMMAVHLNEHDKAIRDRSFMQLSADTELPPALAQVLEFVQARPDLHDTFWRYLALASDAASGDE